MNKEIMNFIKENTDDNINNEIITHVKTGDVSIHNTIDIDELAVYENYLSIEQDELNININIEDCNIAIEDKSLIMIKDNLEIELEIV